MTQFFRHRSFWLSLLFHLVVLSIFVISFEFSGRMPVLENSDKNSNIVNAVVLSETKIVAPKPSRLPPPTKTPEVKPTPPKPLPAPNVEKQAIALPDSNKKKQQALLEKQLLADLQKQVDKQKKIKQQKALEKAFAKELKATAAKSLEQQLQQESDQLANAQAQNMQGIVDKYKALILQAISQHWLVPTNANKKLSSELMIRVAPGGMVLDVQVVKSSGDVALDRSARAAVFKASPLPVPTNSNEFEPFRQFLLKVKPENIMAS